MKIFTTIVIAIMTQSVFAAGISIDPVTGIDMGNNKITNLSQPAAATDAANKKYVDDTVAAKPGDDLGDNVLIVAKIGGDYSGVQVAIDSVTDAAANNPYLVWVAPGVYEEQVTMQPYVHLQGAGQEVTVITSTASSSAWPPALATLTLASDASLRDLTVGNTGEGSRNVALLATAGMTRTLAADVTARAQGGGERNYAIFLIGSGTSVTLQQVTALAESGSYNRGLVNYSGAAVILRGGDFTARGGTEARGIGNADNGTTLEAIGVIALAENGSLHNQGLRNETDAAAMLHGGAFTGRGGTNASGIYNANSDTTLGTENVTALAENGSSNFGLNNDNGAATLRGGSFIARGGNSTRGIYTHNSGTGLKAERVTILGEEGATTNRGLESSNGAAASVTQSVLEGADSSVITTGGGGPVTLSNSRLVGGTASGNVICTAVSRGTTFNANGCP